MTEHSEVDESTYECEHSHEIKPKLTPQRRSQIIRTIWKKLPAIAQGRRDDIRKMAQYSKLCILDAFQGRLSNGLANNSKKSKWIYTIFQIQTSEYLLNTVLLACTLHTCSIFVEPANACPNSVLFKIFQFCIYLVYIVDIALKMSYEGVEEYFKHDWQRLYCANAVVGVIDLLFCGCTFYCNPLRPVAGVLRSRKGRKFFDILKKMLPDVMYGLVPIFFFVIVVMACGNVFFDSYVDNFREIPSIFYNWLYLILTNDTFDRLLPDNLVLNLAYLIFFFPAIYIGQRFLLNLIIGDTYDTFRSLVKKQLKKEKLKEIQGLTKAFSALDDRKTGFITQPVWQECIAALHPELSMEAIALYYEIISSGNNNISVIQFLSLRSVLNFHVTYHDCDNYSERLIDSLYQTVAKPVGNALVQSSHFVTTHIPSTWEPYLLKIMNILEDYHAWERWNLLDLVVLFMGWNDMVLCGYGGGLGLTVGHVLLAGHALELLLRLVQSHGELHSLWEDASIATKLYAIGCVGSLAHSFTTPWAYQWSYIITLPFVSFALTFPKVSLLWHLCRCTRIVAMNEGLDNFMSSLLDLIPSLTETFTFTFIVSYMFGTLGHLLFGHTMADWSSPVLAIVKAQQLTFMVSFLDSMEDAMTQIHPFVTFYFLFFLIVSLTVSNIALSMIIDLHSNLLAKNTPKEREHERKKLDIMFHKLVNQARTRKMLSGVKQVLNFKNIKMSAFQSSDVRKYITNHEAEGDGGIFAIKDLEQCQKYANLNLVDFYMKMHKNEKSVEQEINLLKALMDLNVHQEIIPGNHEVIFRQGAPATVLYILIQGTVLLTRHRHDHHHHHHHDHHHDHQHSVTEMSEEKDEAMITATRFLGLESFLPTKYTHQKMTYAYACIAESDAKLLAISQEALFQSVDAELLGPLLKVVMHATEEIHQLLDGYRKRINLRKSFTKRRSSSSVQSGTNSPRPALTTTTTTTGTPTHHTGTPTHHGSGTGTGNDNDNDNGHQHLTGTSPVTTPTHITGTGSATGTGTTNTNTNTNHTPSIDLQEILSAHDVGMTISTDTDTDTGNDAGNDAGRSVEEVLKGSGPGSVGRGERLRQFLRMDSVVMMADTTEEEKEGVEVTGNTDGGNHTGTSEEEVAITPTTTHLTGLFPLVDDLTGEEVPVLDHDAYHNHTHDHHH